MISTIPHDALRAGEHALLSMASRFEARGMTDQAAQCHAHALDLGSILVDDYPSPADLAYLTTRATAHRCA